MIAREITEDILSISAIDWDRRLFDELVPLPEGTSYNSYLVKGSEKNALIDTAYPPMTAEYIAALKATGIRKLDYIIADHGEQDHTGSIPAVLEIFPDAMVVTNAKCKDMITEALPVAEDKFIVVEDGQTISLGDKTLQFFLTPWVHWPDTMCTYIAEDKILFSCDFFGSHVAGSDLFATNEALVEDAAKRYYAEIMMPFRSFIRQHLEKLAPLQIDFIAPTHGPVYSRPAFILDLYKEWASDVAKKEVVIAYVSMYDNTTKMVDYLTDRLMEKGLSVKRFNMVGVDTGQFTKALVDASTVVFATPTVLTGPHPSVVTGIYLLHVLKAKTKFVAVVNSYGWSGNLADRIKDMLPKLKAQLRYLDPVLVKGLPKENDYKALDRLADEIYLANNPAS
jgi:flavorubredoxin